MLYHLIYVSTAVAPMSEADLLQLLCQSRAHNKRNRVTGMLLYKDGHFMQVLEGQENQVRKTFGRIERSVKHKSIDILRAELIQNRNFPDWTMGFKDMSGIDVATVSGATRFLEEDFKPAYFAENDVEAHAMLLALKDSCDSEPNS